jgi:hypothetical protein
MIVDLGDQRSASETKAATRHAFGRGDFSRVGVGIRSRSAASLGLSPVWARVGGIAGQRDAEPSSSRSVASGRSSWRNYGVVRESGRAVRLRLLAYISASAASSSAAGAVASCG